MENKKYRIPAIILVAILAGIAGIITGVIISPQKVSAEVIVEQMDIDVTIQDDGSAIITQNWTTNVDEGTEFYLYQKDSGYLKFKNLRVSDSNKTYSNIGDWDVDADFDEKAYKCGINEVSDGVELCWGISEYGSNTYTITYELENLIRAYKDNDGCLYRFVNADMEFFPTNVNLNIHLTNGNSLNDSNAKIWGFGYDGKIVFSNGQIVAKTDTPLEDESNITLMIDLDKGLIHPAMSVDESFKDTVDKALKDSSYIDDEFGSEDIGTDEVLLIILVLGVPIAILIIVGVLVYRKDKKEKEKLIEDAPYFYAVPNAGNINAAYVLGKSVGICEDGVLIGARLMRLMMSDAISIDESDDEEDKGMRTMIIKRDAVLEDKFDSKFFDIIKAAAKDKDTLKPKKFRKYCEKHYSKLSKYLEKSEEDGKKYLKDNDCIKKKAFHSRHDLNECGLRELNQTIGIYKYLKTYGDNQTDSNLQQRIWKELLPYSSLFNVVDEFEYGLKMEYGDDFSHNIFPFILFCHYSHTCSNTVYESMNNGMLSSSGGSSSIGGGAGFSGGGGGGVR